MKQDVLIRRLGGGSFFHYGFKSTKKKERKENWTLGGNNATAAPKNAPPDPLCASGTKTLAIQPPPHLAAPSSSFLVVTCAS